MMQLTLTLNWQPALKPGTYPQDQNAIDQLGLTGPGIYVCIQRFNMFSGVYVGKSMNLRNRVHEHLASTVGFRYWLRGSNSARTHSADAYAFTHPDRYGLGQFNDIDAAVKLALDEVKRTEFHYCRLTDITPRPIGSDIQIISELEALLIDTLFDIAGHDPRLLQENSKREPINGLFLIDRSDFTDWLLAQIG